MHCLNDFFCNWKWVIVLIYFVYWYQRPRKSPPGPRGLPLVGYLPFLSKKLEQDIFRLSKNLGSIVSVRIGPTDMVFLNDLESITKAFVKNGAIFSGRGRFPSFESVKKGFGLVFVDSGDFWKTQRKFGLMTLRGFGVGKKGMENICLDELLYLNEEIGRHNGKPFNLSTALHKAVSNNICSIALGKRYNYNDKEFIRMLEIVIEAFDDPWLSFSDKIITLIPFTRYLLPFSYFNRRLVVMLEEVFDWVKTLISEHEKTFDEKNIRDFIDAFIFEKKQQKDSSFTDFQLVNYIHELFVAGTESTSSTLYWGLLCFLHYPETQKKLRKEILEVLGSSGTFSMTKSRDMPYTNAFMQELMRFRTLVPLGLPHKTKADVNLEGYFIRKGTVVMSNIWAVHNDSTRFKNPDLFCPERFLDEEGNFVKSNHVIPFSIGPRFCLGKQLARMEILVFLVGMVQKFEFLPDPDSKTLPTINDGSPGTGFIPIPFRVVAKEY